MTEAERQYDSSSIQILEGLEAVRKRRACTSATRPMAPPASPRIRSGRQLDRRGARRLLRRDRRHHPHRQLDFGGRQRSRHSHRREDGRQARPEAQRRRNRDDRAARRRQVQPEQLQGVGRPARRGRFLRERAVEVAAAHRPSRRQGPLPRNSRAAWCRTAPSSRAPAWSYRRWPSTARRRSAAPRCTSSPTT